MTASRFMSGVSRGRPGTSRNPTRDAAHQVKASCAMPVSGTVQASVSPMSQPKRSASNMAAMNIRFIRTGTNDASVNRPKALSTPDNSATRLMNRM